MNRNTGESISGAKRLIYLYFQKVKAVNLSYKRNADIQELISARRKTMMSSRSKQRDITLLFKCLQRFKNE